LVSRSSFDIKEEIFSEFGSCRFGPDGILRCGFYTGHNTDKAEKQAMPEVTAGTGKEPNIIDIFNQ
jgi:hypothetical protein